MTEGDQRRPGATSSAAPRGLAVAGRPQGGGGRPVRAVVWCRPAAPARRRLDVVAAGPPPAPSATRTPSRWLWRVDRPLSSPDSQVGLLPFASSAGIRAAGSHPIDARIVLVGQSTEGLHRRRRSDRVADTLSGAAGNAHQFRATRSASPPGTRGAT